MKMTITNKITLGFSLGVLAIIGLSLSSYFGAHDIHKSAVDVAHSLEVTQPVTRAKLDHLLWNTELGHILLGQEGEEFHLQLDHRKCSLGKWYYGQGRADAESHSPYLKEPLAALESPHEELHASAREIKRLLAAGEQAAARQYYEEHTFPISNEILGLFDNVLARVDAATMGEEELLQAIGKNEITVSVIGIIGLLLSLGIFGIAAWLRGNIHTILTNAINALSSSSSQISATSEEHEKVLAQQASAVNETTTTMDELDAAARLSTEHAHTAAELVHNAVSNAQEGGHIVEQMIDSMADLQAKVGAISEQIMHLSDKTGQIDNIISTVSELANQTNMLALNAAVEAAHAGEQGKGFAVVAKEIRKLADQSKKSAERIAVLVRDVQEVTSTTVMVAEDGANTLNDTTNTVEQAGGSFSSLAGAVATISDNVQQIALSAKQQETAIEQVVVAMDNINEGAKQSSVGLRQTRDGVDQLVSLARDIREQI